MKVCRLLSIPWELSHFFCGFPFRCQAPSIDHSPPGHELGNHMVIDAPAHKLTESEFESGAVVVGSAVFQPDSAHHGVQVCWNASDAFKMCSLVTAATGSRSGSAPQVV
jgi:hypothetical protein